MDAIHHQPRNTYRGRAGQAALVSTRQLAAEFVTHDPVAQRLAEDLLTLLERTVRTSSAAETIHSWLTLLGFWPD